MDKILSASELYKALDKAGIAKYSYGQKWFQIKEWNGDIVYPRKHDHVSRKFTRKQIEAIVKAFLPGGKGSWKLK